MAADFQFLRQIPPDVMHYLPQFLKRDEHFLKLQTALNQEHEKQRQAVIDIARQFFIDTATWGLPSWERVYATNPPADADIKLRKALVKAKMAGRGIMTKSAVERLINLFTENEDAYIQEDTAAGEFEIIFPSLITHFPELNQVLEEMVPAHLMYHGHITKYKDNPLTANKYAGAGVIQHKKINVLPKTVKDTVLPHFKFSGAGTIQHKRIAISPKLISNVKFNGYGNAGIGAIVHKKICIMPHQITDMEVPMSRIFEHGIICHKKICIMP